ncbi:MAG: hypothetical protein JWQ98_2290 [Chlorobi bacterium]|nr:hypothetical protein [Chlorobiota bacterium]
MKHPVFDKDLTSLLRHCDNADLDPIVSIILASPSQTLTLKEEYKGSDGDHKRYVDEIVYEITSFGGNSLANLVRGQGIPYAEMLRDVASKLSIRPLITDTTSSLETKVILKILKLAYDNLGEEDQQALQELLNVGSDAGDAIDFSDGFPEDEIGAQLASASTSLLGDRIQNAIQTAARSAKLRQTMASVVKSALAKVATAGLGGPVSWTVAIGQGLYELFGPNFTIALGLIAQIGLLRQKHAQFQRDTADQAEELEY